LDPSRLVVIDVETSGTNPLIHELLSVALVPLDSGKPCCAIYIHHPKIEWTKYGKENFKRSAHEWHLSAIPPELAASQIEAYLLREFGGQDIIPVGHNIGFDLSFLKRLAVQSNREAIAFVGHRAVDTHSALFLLHMMNRIPSGALSSDGAFEYFGIRIPPAERHTAFGDAKATRELFNCLLREFGISAMQSAVAGWS
jgi:DNA polymerase III epsilon subunit-like protein